MRKGNQGLTLIELIIVIAILAILIIIAMMSWRLQINKARDAQKKDDLQRVSVAFEEYFSDNECYPSASILENCGGSELDPYLDKVPCDPTTGLPYCYIPDEDNPTCFQIFRVLTPLKNEEDPIITDLNCNGEEHCGYEPECAVPVENVAGFNYGVSSTNITVANPTLPSPTPTPDPGPYACAPPGNCNEYDDTSGCPITFADPGICQEYCDASPDNWCES